MVDNRKIETGLAEVANKIHAQAGLESAQELYKKARYLQGEYLCEKMANYNINYKRCKELEIQINECESIINSLGYEITTDAHNIFTGIKLIDVRVTPRVMGAGYRFSNVQGA